MTRQQAENLAASLNPIPFDDTLALENPHNEVTRKIAEALLLRLLRVWLPEDSQVENIECIYSRNEFYFQSPITPDIQFHFAREPGGDNHANIFHLSSEEGCFLTCWQKEGHKLGFGAPRPLDPRMPLDTCLRRLADEWLPSFRRGCWLSGCDIDATAHEKAEWIQGFTHEEIEAWNLKF